MLLARGIKKTVDNERKNGLGFVRLNSWIDMK
jgi:hypothetical protein